MSYNHYLYCKHCNIAMKYFSKRSTHTLTVSEMIDYYSDPDTKALIQMCEHKVHADCTIEIVHELILFDNGKTITVIEYDENALTSVGRFNLSINK